MISIPKDELQYFDLVQYLGEETGELLIGIVHQSELDWKHKDFKSENLLEIIQDMD